MVVDIDHVSRTILGVIRKLIEKKTISNIFIVTIQRLIQKESSKIKKVCKCPPYSISRASTQKGVSTNTSILQETPL